MKLLNIISTSVFQILSLIFLVGYFLGVLNMYFSDKNNYCEMTYMFEYPQFVHISLEENNRYPQYGLYAYSEGRFTEKARKMWFDGIPVLFLPGNSGSHMQARSLASVALRKALAKGYEQHFDYFTISYSEEYSGLYGGVLQSQTQFAAACISKILSLYKSNKYTKAVPTSVIVIGHSMGGLVAKRLMAYPSTLLTTNVVITLAAPLEAPVINFDSALNDYYVLMDLEWEYFVAKNDEVKNRKILISIGSGPRDLLLPAGLTSSNSSYINALATAIPGVWVSPNHVSMVWCKQLVLVINRYLFDIIDPNTSQITENTLRLTSKARQYFQANRSMTLSPEIKRPEVPMTADAFWYEDNRRIYQISRPSIERTTYLMIRLVSFPQNRFVAIESVNVDDRDWIFGCNAMHIHNTYRYCKQATSLGELSRWSGAAKDFGRRKLATIHLHSLIEQYPEWSHVLVKVSPTRKPVVLNVDINDHASRQIAVDLPYGFSLNKQLVKAETDANSLYYELLLPGFNVVYQAYLLYMEPTASCQASQYHVTAELHVPWAENHENYHYFTHLKTSPMKLRLFKSNPNMTSVGESNKHVKVTLLLDPQCTFRISISTSWYHRLAQFARNYTPVLVPYVAAIVLLAARTNFVNLKETGMCVSIHGALMSEGVKPYYALAFGRFGAVALMSIPSLAFLFENASWKNLELQLFTKSLLVLPAYMIALGILNIAAAGILAVMVFSSQLAHRLLFRIMWRGGTGLAEKVASGLQKVPLIVSTALICATPLSCGAASLAAGAAFYAFMISKMYEEYLEDYVYKLMAKVASRICRIFKSEKNPNKHGTKTPCLALQENSSNTATTISNNIEILESKRKDSISNEIKEKSQTNMDTEENSSIVDSEQTDETKALVNKEESSVKKNVCDEREERKEESDIDENLNNLNFHMTLFFMWMVVTIVNIPALLTWARNYKFSMVLKPDTSYHTGLMMSICSCIIWQQDGPRRNLRYYEAVGSLLFTMAIFVLVLGPLSLVVVNYGVTFMFAIITLQQVWDKGDDDDIKNVTNDAKNDENNLDETENETNTTKPEQDDKDNDDGDKNNDKSKDEEPGNSKETKDNCDVCSESRIYNVFKNLREKFSFNNEV